MKNPCTAILAALALLLFAFALPARAQATGPDSRALTPGETGLALAPARQVLRMMPGEEKTVVVNVRYSAVSSGAEGARLKAYLVDWDQASTGEARFHRAGTRPDSASQWLLFSPAEMRVAPGVPLPIRVTISVPRDAEPGDHLVALMVEPRLASLKTEGQSKHVRVAVRLGTLFYIMVGELTAQLALEDLAAEVDDGTVVVTPTLRNTGNSHVRPLHGIEIFDAEGARVAGIDETEGAAVLGGSRIRPPLKVSTALAPGRYTVRYRVDPRAGAKVLVGEIDLSVSPVERLAHTPSDRAATEAPAPGQR